MQQLYKNRGNILIIYHVSLLMCIFLFFFPDGHCSTGILLPLTFDGVFINLLTPKSIILAGLVSDKSLQLIAIYRAALFPLLPRSGRTLITSYYSPSFIETYVF